MPEINWNLARTPDFAGNAYAARAQGQADRRQQGLQNAYATYAQDPSAGIKAIAAYDPVAAGQLEDRQLATQTREARTKAAGQYTSGDIKGAQSTAAAAGDFDLLKQFRDMTKEQLEENKRINDTGISVSLTLKKVPPEQRQAQLQVMAPQLRAQGFTDEQIAAIPTDDVAIDAGVGLAMKAAEIIAQEQKDREFKAGREDQKWEQGFKTKQFGETVRSNRVQEGQGAARLAIARQSEARQGASAMTAARGRPIPSPIATGYGENVTALSKIDAAIAALKAHPKAVGLSRVAGDNINQRLDPAGVDARAALADIGSQKLHDRSGAAVSAAESPRLMPFIPQVTDNSETAIKKLTRLKQEYLSNNSQIEAQFGPESGYQPLRMGAPTVAPAAPSAGGGTVLRFDARGNRIK